jgi:uncharacterized integral membrane protein
MRFDERNEIMQLICRYRAAAVILAAGCLLGIFSVINALPPNFDECDWAFAIIDAVPIFLSALLGASIAEACGGAKWRRADVSKNRFAGGLNCAGCPGSDWGWRGSLQ